MVFSIKKNIDFKLIKKIGAGGFSKVYHAIDNKNNIEIAIKLEPIKSQQPQLFYETNIYKQLLTNDDALNNGIPQVYQCQQNSDYNMMIMDLLGKNLEDLFESNNKKFSLKTVLMLGLQMISIIEYIHQKSFLHRDLKPSNFLLGRGKFDNKLFIIDFGLAKQYIKNKQHIEFKSDKHFLGTARYSSLNQHLGIEQSRRDDLESIGYIMIYFLKGILPWENLRAKNTQEKYQKIKKIKISISVEKLSQGLPIEFTTYLSYCRKLKFEEKPNYDYLKNLLKEIMKKNLFEFDYKYDWILSKEKGSEKEFHNSLNSCSSARDHRQTKYFSIK